jgi:hypothetical protein
MKQSIIFVIILTFINAQTGSEIYLFDLLSVDDKYAIANPVNISDNPGYDNQPSFMILFHTEWPAGYLFIPY